MALSQHDHVIQTFAPDGTHKSFCEGILARTLRRDHYFLGPQPSDPTSKIVAVDSVAVSDQVGWNGVLRKGLDYLLPGPGCSRIPRHVEVNQPPPMMGQDYKNEQDPERGGWNGEVSDFSENETVERGWLSYSFCPGSPPHPR